MNMLIPRYQDTVLFFLLTGLLILLAIREIRDQFRAEKSYKPIIVESAIEHSTADLLLRL